MADSVLSHYRLSDEQRQAACQMGCDTVVLASAGCGKTATLVGHYLYLLAQGVAPEEVVAITFTERAGQEMRVRIRRHLRRYLDGDPEDRSAWLERYMALDAAPIGTIHSYCARLLRAHPAEVGLDPDFAVLDENQAAGLQAEAVDRALVWATQEPQAVACFPLFGGPEGLRDLLLSMVAQRLAVREALAKTGPDVLSHWRAAALQWLQGMLGGPTWQRCLAELESLVPVEPGDPLDERRLDALAAVRAAQAAAAEGNWQAALGHLAGVRRPGSAGRRQNWGDQAPAVRQALRTLCDLKEGIDKVAGNADPALDEELAAAWPGLVALFERALQEYAALKVPQQAVDFDDLEAGALHLLQTCPEVAAYHHGRIKAVLVDEFQDTNDRQRRLIEALLGAPAGRAGRLFIVGDAKQSIYRFRGADVTVFRGVEKEISGAGGQTHRLSGTYRAHAGLVAVLNQLLDGVLGGEEERAELYRVPFAPLRAATDRPARLHAPFVELHLGLGEDAAGGRVAAAQALALRLARMRREEGVGWGEVVCLFRATTNFPIYEAAFEAAGIPYVTVAGAGFYARPEVRDLLNALRALANPTDDLAVAGLLRSPAMGLADSSLYLLRWGPGGEARPLWAALQGDLSMLGAEERGRALRAAEIAEEVASLAGRQPVATVLKRFLDLTGYRAMLRLCPEAARAVRNVDKLLADAHQSGLVGVSDFLAHVQTLHDTAAREGEAPPEAGEAVQLMSVHKAKGLEFNIVTIADAGHDDRARVPRMLLHPQWGMLLRVTRADGSDKREGLAHGLGRSDEEAMQDAEERRLLYVAATRAKEKLLVSGHVRRSKSGLSTQGWVRRIMDALGEEAAVQCEPLAPGAQAVYSLWGGEVSLTLYCASPEVEQAQPAPQPASTVAPAASLPARLAPPLLPREEEARDEADRTPNRVWRVLPATPRQRAPRWLVGKLAHLGLRLWRFEREPALLQVLQASARGAGLTDERQIRRTLDEALRLLARFHEHPLFAELDAAARYHEVPYVVRPDADPWGRIDLLCRVPGGRWRVVDFKTNHLWTASARQDAIRHYSPQLQRYRKAVLALLGADPRLSLCFLDYHGRVDVYDLVVLQGDSDMQDWPQAAPPYMSTSL